MTSGSILSKGGNTMNWKIWVPIAIAAIAGALYLLSQADGDISIGGETPGAEVQGKKH
jgi:hypothetical protein